LNGDQSRLQQAQSSVVELKALFTKTGHFVLSIAENCFALQKFPSADSFGDAVNKLGRYASSFDNALRWSLKIFPCFLAN
jgi:hypothetical protein